MIGLIPLPGFVEMPAHTDGAAAIDDYIRRLLDFAAMKNARALQFISSLRMMNALTELGRYPFFHHVQTLLRQNGLDAYSAQDINSVLQSIFVNGPCLETVSGIDDVLSSGEAFSPQLDECGCSAVMRDEAVRLLLTVALWKSCDDKQCPVIGIKVPQVTSILSKATIEIVASERTFDVPISLQQELLAAGSLAAVVAHVDVVEMLTSANDREQCADACRIAVLRDLLREDSSATFMDVPDFVVRSEFVDSMDLFSFRRVRGRAERMMRAIVDVVRGRNLSQGHPLRVSAGGGADNLYRGDDLAWRHDVDREFHLHLWRCSTGPEFVKIVNHEDFSIEE